jgi:hypothetical protein
MAVIFKKIFPVVICLVLSSSALAAHIDLAWDRNSEPDVAGYVVYYGNFSKAYTESLDVGNTTSVRIAGLSKGTEYFFALTAYDIYDNESDFSAEVSGYAFPADDLTAPGDDPTPPGDDPSYRVSDRASSRGGCFIGTSTRMLFGINNQPKILSYQKPRI